MEATDIPKLAEEFPKEDVHWRSQVLTGDGTRARALAYIDARNVMDRLDKICGSANWQDEYNQANGRTICRLGIRIDGEWVWKSDGAGDTQVEAEKGSISDAFKRAAVKWGIGRYLYALPTPWVPCSFREKDGKKYFDKFTADPWSLLDGKAAEAAPTPEPSSPCLDLLAALDEERTKEELEQWQVDQRDAVKALPAHEGQQVKTKWDTQWRNAA